MAGNRSGPTYIYDSNAELKHLQLQIGSELYPEYPINSHAECFYNLRKSLGVQANNLHSLDMNTEIINLLLVLIPKNVRTCFYRNKY